MKPKDPDTFIDIGVSITRLLLIASGQGTAASLIGEGAGLIKNLGSLLGSGGQRAVSAEKIADDVADQLFREHEGISEADWQVAATNVAPLIDRLSEKDRLAAGYDWKALRPVLRDLGGEERRRKLADESARRAFDLVLDVACQRITDCFTQEEALASLLKKVNEDCARLQRIERLLDRPGVQETRVVINDHIEVLRHLAPDTLVDREQELADLEAFVCNSDGVWYAMEADMVSGKTAVMASFALNPPDDVHMASFFIRRIGGDRNDRGSFAFVMGAQLAKILGHEYTEPVRDPAQCTEFRQLLRRAATACRSETTPRPLVLLIDGIDEDSYFENPDGADAKSILSLLPRRLPEGVKIITASRPNPRLPEDVLCDENRRIVSLKPSPIAEKSINRKDMKIFFKSDVAVDIGAFLAACGGVLTVEDLRTLLIMRGHQRTLTWDVRAYVNRSPGRILTPIDVGFSGQEVLAYRLGHDVVTRAVIRELDPDSFGEGDEPEDERWWVPIREKALAPYRAIIRNWVKECAKKGWSNITSGYMLSRACFDFIVVDDSIDESLVEAILNQDRYKEMCRRSKRLHSALNAIDTELSIVLKIDREGCSEVVMKAFYEGAEFRNSFAQPFAYVPGILTLHILHFGTVPELVLEMVLSIDDPEDRLRASKEVAEASVKSNHGRVFLALLPAMVKSLVSYQELRDKILSFLINILACAINAENDRNPGCDNSLFLRKIVLNDIMSSIAFFEVKNTIVKLRHLIENADKCGENFHKIEFFPAVTEIIVGWIEDPWARARALTGVARVLAGVGLAEHALDAAERIEDPWARARALAGVARALVGAGLVERAREAAEDAARAAEQIRASWPRARELAGVGLAERALDAAEQIRYSRVRARALVDVARALVGAGLAEHALDAAERIEDPEDRARALADAAKALVGAGLAERAREVAEDAARAAEWNEGPEDRACALADAARVLVGAGLVERAREAAEDAARAAEQIRDPRVRARVLAGVARVLAGVGLAEHALDAAERIEEPEDRAWVLADIARALVGAGLVERAREAAEEAARAARRIGDFWVRARVAKVIVKESLTGAAREIAEMIGAPEYRGQIQSAIIKMLVRNGSSDAAAEALRAEFTWARGIAQRQDAADYCAVLAGACLDAADLVDAGTTTHEQWLGLARSALARSWLYGAPVWNRFDVLLRVAPDLATRLVEERLLAEPEPASPASSVDPASPEELEGPEGPGGGAPSSR